MNRDDYVNLLALLLPPVSYNPNGEHLRAELRADARLLARAEQAVLAVLTAINPLTAVNTLPDWERVYDLIPGDDGTLQQRRERAMAALAETGGLSRDYFIHLGSAMGYTLTIDEPDDPMWLWKVNVQGAPERTWYFRVGESSVGDRLEESGDPGLEEIFRHLKPAHTECVFVYSEGGRDEAAD